MMFRNVATLVPDQNMHVKSILEHVRGTTDHIGMHARQ